jgi:hypothetical protein
MAEKPHLPMQLSARVSAIPKGTMQSYPNRWGNQQPRGRTAAGFAVNLKRYGLSAVWRNRA